MKVIHTKSFEETRKAGAELARKLTRKKTRKALPADEAGALVLALSGDLGAGKTTFLQGFAKGLGIEEVVNSPTFVIQKRFMIYDLRFKNFYHIDCYRLEKPEEILELGFKEIISDPQNIVAIEWPEKIASMSMLPENTISIVFKHIAENKREIVIQ